MSYRVEWRKDGGPWTTHPSGPWDDKSVADSLAYFMVQSEVGVEAKVVEVAR